nr:lysozyme [Aminobacter aminovorans]
MASRLMKSAAAMAAAVSLIGGYEGLRLNSYQDVIGVWTACYGETRGIRPSMTFTKAECDAQFAKGLVEFETGMRACLKQPDAVPIKPYIAFLSLSYNIGLGAFCKSSVARYANAGDLRAACNRIPAFNKAGGRVIKGLVSRRGDEQKYCLSGL